MSAPSATPATHGSCLTNERRLSTYSHGSAASACVNASNKPTPARERKPLDMKGHVPGVFETTRGSGVGVPALAGSQPAKAGTPTCEPKTDNRLLRDQKVSEPVQRLLRDIQRLDVPGHLARHRGQKPLDLRLVALDQHFDAAIGKISRKPRDGMTLGQFPRRVAEANALDA